MKIILHTDDVSRVHEFAHVAIRAIGYRRDHAETYDLMGIRHNGVLYSVKFNKASISVRRNDE